MKKTFTKTINTFPISVARLLLFLCLLAFAGNTYATIRYVKTTGTGDGTSWQDASNNFQAMIDASSSGDEVWVAGGTYQRASGEFFSMKEGVKIYGGFAEEEESLSLRNLTITANATILKGNGSSVVRNYTLTSAALLDGFTITGGSAERYNGGGMYNDNASPSLTNCSFTNNTADYGGGMYNLYSNPHITNCSFTNNKADYGRGGSGGGMYNEYSSPPTTNCSFTNNKAYDGGGGMYNYSSYPSITNCSFISNESYNGGGMYNRWNSTPAITNCLITKNKANYGAGMYTGWAAPVLTNCTITNNTADVAGGGMYFNWGARPILRNTIIYGNSSGIYQEEYYGVFKDVSYSLVQGITNTHNQNISGDVDPLFLDPEAGNYQLQPCSPLIDKGGAEYYFNYQNPNLFFITTDLAGKDRFYNGGSVDMGAYELQITPVLAASASGVIHVKPNGIGTGEDWACPTGDLQAAINTAASGQQVWVAAGTYQPDSSESFIMKEGVKIYGGFAGTEQNLDQRDLTITSNASILRGNGAAVVSNDNNGLTIAAVLDGFTVTGGSNANRYRASGNGIYNKLSSPTFANLIVSNNVSITGGGIANYNSSPVFTNCFITDNNSGFPESSGQGGGMYNSDANPTLINCSITGNSSNDGGGGGMINLRSNPTLNNCLITGNTCGTGTGGGIYNLIGSHPTLTNCLISNNTAANGGGMSNNTSSPILTNCTISNNIGSDYAGICNLNQSFPKLRNTIVYGNNSLLDGSGSMSDIKYSLVEGENNPNPEDHNIAGNVDPLFVNSTEGDYRLNVCSPVINKGSNSYYASGETPDLSAITTDLQGENRFYNSGSIDIGAYERQISPLVTASANGVIYVKPDGTGTGESWACATGDFQAAMNAAASEEQVWVAGGTYQPASGQSFKMNEGVKIYGGFAGTEASLSVRNLTLTAKASILKGNGSSVVSNSGLTSEALLDGFTITGGVNSGIVNHSASPTLINCSIKNNTTAGSDGGAGMLDIDNSSPILTNCAITNNTANHSGGAGGGMSNINNASPILTNCTIAHNSALSGGAMYNDNGSSPKLRNTIIFGNDDGIYNKQNSAPVITYSLVQGITSTDNYNIPGDTNPLFVDPANGDYRLQPCNPVINKGSNSYYASGETPDLSAINTDVEGKNRFYNGGSVDMGAYELQITPLLAASASGVIHVKPNGTGTGEDWACPTGDLQAAIFGAKSGQQVWVAGGTYQTVYYSGFRMKEGVKIYGGFAGTENDLSQRNLKETTNRSILKGDVGTIFNDRNKLTNAAVLDGFTITAAVNGGIMNYDVSPMFVNLIITKNESGAGGGMYNLESSPTLINCVFSDNEGASGAIVNYSSSPVLINCTIFGNKTINNKAVITNSESSVLRLVNSIVYGNDGDIINSDSSTLIIEHSLVQGMNSTDNNNISGDLDPLFVDPANGDFRLQPCSPVINKGSNSYYNSGQTPDLWAITIDLAGEPRFYDNGTVDMGAYEFAGIPTPALAVDNDEADVVISGDYSLMVNGSSCTALAFVSPNGTSPLSGEVTAKVWVETTQPSNFLKRHYEITPTTGAETATAKVTLYFTQQEFTDFNAVNSLKLPVDAADTENYKAHLRIEKRTGESDDGSGLPESYDGTAVPINPLDPAVNGSITWNANAGRWEVSFDVTGFSGFFAKTTEASLPLNLLSFTGSKEAGSNLLTWKTTNEANFSHFDVQHSRNAISFTALTAIDGNSEGTCHYTHNSPFSGINYYRLKLVDRDGTFAYSKIIALNNEGNRPAVYPNPVTTLVTVGVDNSLLKSTVTLYDITGRLLQSIAITTSQQQINVSSLASGVYVLKFADGTTQRFVKE